MATTKFYLDKRSVRKDGTYPLKVAISRNCKTAFYSLGIYLTEKQWDNKSGKILNHPNKQFVNGFITRRRAEIETFILKLTETGEISGLRPQDIKDKFIASEKPVVVEEVVTFEMGFQEFMNKKDGSTKDLYEFTLRKLKRFCPELSSLKFEDITPRWLEEFENGISDKQTSKNYRNILLRNIRSVFNYAIDSDITSYYPFRKFKIKPEETRKRALTLKTLRELFNYKAEDYAVIYQDMFKLIFMLIGINTIDLHRLKEITPDGRLEFKRAKTKKLFSIKVEPEAMEIINKYKGKKGLLEIADRWSDHRNFRHQLNSGLQNLGVKRVGSKKKKVKDSGPFHEVSSYWARHSWATIAADLDIPDAVIAMALGHASEHKTTDIYILRNRKKVDKANRIVLDWVLYGKKTIKPEF